MSDIAANAILKAQRCTQLDNRKLKYEWQAYPENGLPSGIHNLPSDDSFEAAKSIDFNVDGLAGSSKKKVEDSIYVYHFLASV